MLKKLLVGFVLVASLAGCLKGENNNTCAYDPCTLKAPATETQAVQDYLTANNITNAQQHCSGFFYVVDNAGTGRTPTACNYINATYVGKLTNGNTFDERTADFGLTQVILGWTNGIPLIKEGGRIRLFIPPSLGYGNQPNGSIPANSILVFDVTLNGIY